MKRISITKALIITLLSLQSFKTCAGKFISYVNGVNQNFFKKGKYIGLVEIRDGQLISITPLSKKEAIKLSKKVPVKKQNGKIVTIFPSDYSLGKSLKELSRSKNIKKKRSKNWKKYIKQGSYSLFLDKDEKLQSLPYSQRQKIITKRNNAWDKFIQLYSQGDYVSVTDEAPKFYKWPSHRAAAAFFSGVSYSKFNELSKSLIELNRAIKFDFKNPQVYFEKGKVLLSMDKLDESYHSFRTSLRKNNKRFLSMYYLGWIKEIQEEYKVALDHYEELLKEKYLDIETAQSVAIRRGEIFDKITTDSNADPSLKAAVLNKKIMLPGREAFEKDPDSENGRRLKEFLQKLQQKFDLPSVIPLKIGSMGNYVRLNQYLSYNSNVPSLSEENLQFRDSYLMNTIFVYKHFFTSKKGFRHTPEVRLNYVTHFERNIQSIYSQDSWNVGPSLRNSFKHKTFGNPSQFVFDIETSYNTTDYDGDLKNEFFSRSIKYNLGENLNLFKIGGTNIRLRQDFRRYYDSTLDSSTFTLFVNQLFNLSKRRTISLIANADFSSVEDSRNDANTYMLRLDYLHPRLIKKWELQTAFTFLGTDTKAQSDTRGFETNLSYEMEWRRKFLKDFEFAFNYNYTINNSKDEINYGYDKHLIALELQYSPRF